MWPPPNIQSLPSKEEIQKAKDEISTIEMEIAETELRLDALRKSLLERKAWIAPIRTTPSEILSLVFIEASKDAWKAPLVLQSVSRRWRDVVLDTPIAWTFIPLSKYSSKPRLNLISLFLERSRNTPLHISVENDSLLRYMTRLGDRIECIHLETAKKVLPNYYLQGPLTFHRLERLKIDMWCWDSAVESLPTDDPATWDMLLFPNLKLLDIKSASFSFFRAISAAPEFPAIRHLKMNCQGPGRLAGILTKCAKSLESLDLTYDTRQSEVDTEHEIHFPHLRYLRLDDWSDGDEPCFRFKASTPNLQAYFYDGPISTLNAVKVDTSSTILLHVCCTPDLSQYPQLVNLRFGQIYDQSEALGEAIGWLCDEPARCPNLASIEYIGELSQVRLGRASLALLAREKITGQTIQLTRVTFERRDERVRMFKEVELCGDHMPCNL